MAMMAQNGPTDDQINAVAQMAAQQAPALTSMAPVNPHDSLVAPISAAPVRMSASAPVASSGKMSLDPVEGNINKRLVSDYQKDADPYGSPDNHPGFLGKFLHGLNVATGGVNRRGIEEQKLENRAENLSKLESEENLQGAQAGNQTAEAGKNAEETSELPGKTKSEEDLQSAQTTNLNSEAKDRDAAQANPTLIVGHAHAVNKAIQENRDPAQDPTVKAYEKALQSTVPGFNKQGEAPKTITAVRPGIQGPHEYAWNPKTSAYDIDEGQHYEKPQVINVNAGERLEREGKNDVLKAYQPTMDSAERMNVMTDAYEKAVKDHDQQAMLNLLANHLGMTMGLQKGARLTRDIVHEAQNSQPWLQGVAAKFDKDGYLSGVTLSPQQMRQMVSLGQERYAEDANKSRSTAQYLGAKDDGPARIPGKSTINYYLGLAGGNPQKAKSLAAQDGWTTNGGTK